MRVALIQLDVSEVVACEDNGIPIERIKQLLDFASEEGTDLVVFPECYPFFNKDVPASIEAAADYLEKLSEQDSPAFIAGGYVMQGGCRRNVSFLVHNGKVDKDAYFKQVPWGDESFRPGRGLLKWCWEDKNNKHQVIPLICADVCVPWNEPDGLVAEMMGQAAALGAGPWCPIIVSTFGYDLRTPYWTEPLWA